MEMNLCCDLLSPSRIYCLLLGQGCVVQCAHTSFHCWIYCSFSLSPHWGSGVVLENLKWGCTPPEDQCPRLTLGRPSFLSGLLGSFQPQEKGGLCSPVLGGKENVTLPLGPLKLGLQALHRPTVRKVSPASSTESLRILHIHPGAYRL